MALDIVTQDSIIDETIGVQDDDLLNPGSNSNTTLQYLLGLDLPGGLPPEVAFQANFVQATASARETITGIVLAQDASGTPFSTTVGVSSGLRTVDGNYVWLFRDATHTNVVLGVIGTSDPAAAPAAGGPLAFSLGLDGSGSAKDLYTVQYVALLHPNSTDPDDRVDLTDKVFASVTGTATANFSGAAAAPGNHDFYLINATNDASKQLLVTAFEGAANATANVSDQGFGVNSQSIDSQPTNETLQVDFVTGGTLPAGSGSQIQYGSHLEDVTQAGFTVNQITPSSPDRRVDVTIKAFNNTGNEQGSDFFNGTSTNGVDIVSIKLAGATGVASPITADGTYATASGSITVTGLSGTGNAVTITGLDNVTVVDVTTSAAMDRLTITAVDANEGLDVSEIHFTSTRTNAHNEEVGSFINFDDDGPSIDPSQAAVPTLTTDDTEIVDSAAASFAAVFTSSFGQDGFKDTDNNNVQDADAITYALGVKGGGSDIASGLTDTLSGDAVVLNKVGGDIVGTVTGTSVEVLRISVDAAGQVTFTQSRSVVHNDPADPAETGASAAGLASADLVTLTATITDGDGDTAHATRDIGSAFKLEDDGPSIDPSQTAVPTLTTDDTEIVDSAAASFAGLFTSAFGQDGFKDTDDNNVQDADAITYALGVKGGGSDVASGLTDTLSGDAVVLNKVGSDIVGTVTGTSVEVLRISVDAAGQVTFTQSRSVVHNDPADPAETGASAAGLTSADLVTLTATITDGDGDTAHATRDIGSAFKLEDDGPSIDPSQTAVPTLTTDDTEIVDSAAASFAGLFTSAFGQDGFKDTDDNNVQDADAITYALGVKGGGSDVASGLTDTLSGDAVVLNKVGGDVVGTVTGTSVEVLRISVDAAGQVTFTQSRSVVHNDPADPAETGASAAGLASADLVTLTATITDGDGDTDSATRDIGSAFKLEDDGPSIVANGNPVPTLAVYETDLATNASASFAGLFTSAFGQDGFKDTDDNDVEDADALSYALGISAGATGLKDAATNEVVTLSVNAAGTIVTGSSLTGGTAFTITVDADTGLVTLDQVRTMVHDDPSDPTPFPSNLVNLTAKIIDGDADTATATRDIGLAFNLLDPGISIDKTATIADGHADQAGDIINYTVTVANTGNVVLNNVQVTDSFEGAASVVLTNANSSGNTFNDPNGNGFLDIGETWTYTYKHVVTQNELNTKGIDGDGSLDNTATVTTTAPDLGPLQDDASIPILLGPGVRTPGFWVQSSWLKFWDGIAGNEPKQAGTNGFADGEITILVDSNKDGAANASDAKGLLIGDFSLDGVVNGGEKAFFIGLSDALALLNASQKQLQNAEYQEGRALVATWLNYLAGNPIEAGNANAVDAKDAIQWAVDWMLKTTNQSDGNITLADMNNNAVAASSTAWNVGIDGPDANATPTAYAAIPQYNATADIPAGVQILGVLDEYNNHGTVYGTAIATA